MCEVFYARHFNGSNSWAKFVGAMYSNSGTGDTTHLVTFSELRKMPFFPTNTSLTENIYFQTKFI